MLPALSVSGLVATKEQIKKIIAKINDTRIFLIPLLGCLSSDKHSNTAVV